MVTCTEVKALEQEFRAYVGKLKADWLSENRVHSNCLYELMSPEEQRRVDRLCAAWGRHITPFAEAWWKERGYGVIWPEDNSKPMQVYKLEAA